MSKRDVFWESIPKNKDGEIAWPDNLDDRRILAIAILGARVVGAVEAVYEKRLEVINAATPCFTSMSEGQRDEVRRLVKDACFSTLYWVLVKLKDYPSGNVDLTVTPISSNDELLPQIGAAETEVFHNYFSWVEQFSEYGDK